LKTRSEPKEQISESIVMNWGWNLEEYIEHLLRLGKKRDSEEFQKLMTCFGEKKIVDKANEIRAKIRENSKTEKEGE